ncbi:MAG TPA: hypothetical protein VF444_17160 [Pseudonocardiaceae bacterium]
MNNRSKIGITVLVIGILVFVASVVLGVVGAEQFREFIQYGYHLDDSCEPLAGHAGLAGAGALSQVAIWLSTLGLALGAGTIFFDRRPLLMLGALTLVGSCGIAMWLNLSVTHTIVACAPFKTLPW